jgi:hypothetical protein
LNSVFWFAFTFTKGNMRFVAQEFASIRNPSEQVVETGDHEYSEHRAEEFA